MQQIYHGSATAGREDWTGRLGVLSLLGVLFAALLVSRQPSVILHADFWGEDGWVWYPDARDRVLTSFFLPQTGYLQTIPRLGALLAQPFPLAFAPTVFALIALVMQVLPPVFLVSARMADAWPNRGARLGSALIMIGLPNSFEVFVKLTDTQWHLAILTFLVTVSRPPSSRAGRLFDVFVLAIGGLSGPFCLMLTPVAAWHYWETRDRAVRRRLILLLATGFVQALSLMLAIASRSQASLGASLPVFARIVGLNIFLAVFLGQQRLGTVLAGSWWQPGDAGPLLVSGAGFVLIGCGLWLGGGVLRKAWLFAALSFAAALVTPQVNLTGAQWHEMTFTGWGDRYYVFPMLAFIGALFALAGARPVVLRVLGGLGVVAVVIGGVAGDWVYPVMPPTDFADRARAFAQAPPGTVARLPIHPTGAEMWLQKR